MKIFHLNSGISKKGGCFARDVCYNIGNFVPTYAILNLLKQEITDEDHVPNIWQDDIDIEHINTYDHVCLYLQDQLRTNVSYFDPSIEFKIFEKAQKVIESIDIPITVFGLGCNDFGNGVENISKTLQPYKINFINALSKKCKNIGIRGENTKIVLDDLGIKNYAVVGCPSIFYHGENQPRINFPLNIENIVKGGDTDSSNINKKIYMILQDEAIHIGIYDGIEYVSFENFNSWIDFYREKKIDLSISSRVHGSIMSLLSGVPAICTNRDARAQEMCKLMSIPLFNGSCKTVIEYINDHGITFENFNENYINRFKIFKDWMISEGLIF